MKTKFLILAAMALPLLFTNCSSNGGVEPEPEPEPTILTFKNHLFSSDMEEGHEAARFFSTSLNQSIKVSGVTDENAPKIDLGFGSMENVLYFFVSPNDTQYGIGNANATKTEYMLDLDGEKITAAEFDAIAESGDFAKFSFAPNKEGFGNTSAEDGPFFCFFKNSAGKIGVMKITKLSPVGTNPGVTVDIKMQK
jgi:hypothetical protein